MTGSHTIVLGHTGFLGRALYRHMTERGDPVSGYSSAQADLRDPRALARLGDVPWGASTVIVTAALTPDRGSGLAQFADHTSIVLNVARFFGEREVRRVVYVSTDGVCAASDEPISEDCPIACDNLYTLAKYLGERVFSQSASERGFSLLTIRPVAIFGPGDPHNSYGPNRFVRSIAERRSIELVGEGEELRDHLFVDDATVAIRQLASSDATGVVTLATGVSRSFASIVDELVRICPFPITMTRLPRRSPVTHRRFRTDRLRSIVPDLGFTSFESALSTTLHGTLGAHPS